MPLPWGDALWLLSTEQPTFACAPPYIGNGRLGLRLGAFILGTDQDAPPQRGAGPDQTFLAVPRFDHTFPLQSYATHVRDGYLHCLPAWAQLDLRVGPHEFRPGRAITSSRRPLTTSLDLRTGEAAMRGDWMVSSGAVAVDIRALIPRNAPHAGLWQLTLDGLDEQAEIAFGLDGMHLAGDVEQHYADVDGDTIGELRTLGRGRAFVAGLRWRGEGVVVVSDDVGETGRRVRLRSTGRSVRLSVVFACHGGTENGGRHNVLADLGAVMSGIEDGSLRRENEELWRELWADGLDVTALPLSDEDRRLLLAQQFYLLASYDESRHPVGPVGVSNNQWLGAHMWDADLWHGHALVALWPRLARRIARARIDMLPAARAYASQTGFRGARLAWLSDETGAETAPAGPYREELHVNAWAMLLAWDIWRATGDRDFLEESWPLLADVAEFLCSRASRDDDGSWHLRGVLGPDEAVHENPANPQLCDDNVTTNLAVRTALQATAGAAAVLGRDAPRLCGEVADGLVLLAPDADGIIPEYDGYAGQTIKQADLILSFFPLQLKATPEEILANVDYYDSKIGAGPLMTDQIAAAVRLRAGAQDKGEILRGLVRAYRRCVHGAFEVPYEVACNSNSLMLTACGGLISALAYGWWDYREPGDDPAILPRLGAALAG